MDMEVVADYGNVVGEGPTWDPRERRLYWIDIPNGRIFRYDPASGEHAQIYDGPMMGGFTMQQDGSLLLFMERGAIGVLRDGKLEYLVDELPGEDGNRFNDVIADPAGRVFGGTMPVDTERAMAGENVGTLYRVDTDGSTTPIMTEVGIPNGLGFTPDGKGMYFTDSTAYKIFLLRLRRGERRGLQPAGLRRDRPRAGPPGRHDGRRGGLRLVGPGDGRGRLPVRAGRPGDRGRVVPHGQHPVQRRIRGRTTWARCTSPRSAATTAPRPARTPAPSSGSGRE